MGAADPPGGLSENEEGRRKTAAHASEGHDLEQRLRAIVVGGLRPLLLKLLDQHDGGPRIPPPSLAQMRMLGLVERSRGREVVTDHGIEVTHQLAALYFGRVLPVIHEVQRPAWHEVLFADGRPSERGARLLGWLRVGLADAGCHVCAREVTGITGLLARLACNGHRDGEVHRG